MKKVVVFAVLAMVLVGSIAAQSAAADAQRIVGTWTQVNTFGHFPPAGTVWVFNANGTGTAGGYNIIFGISANGQIRIRGFRGGPLAAQLFMSPDGRRMSIGELELTRN